MTEVGIDGRTQLVGLMGYPVEHSFSPAMHNAAFAALELNWRYVPLLVRPTRVGDAVRGLPALGFRGANVTIPHKAAVMAHLDEVAPDAQVLGAVNTIVVDDDGQLRGHNTDWQGFLRSLAESDFNPQGKRALVLGAGGAARAVVYALAHAGAEVIVLNRTEDKAQRLAQDIREAVPRSVIRAAKLSAEWIHSAAQEADLLVNATSLGMYPQVDTSPYPDGVPYPSHLTVCDLVYNPRETRLMRRGRAAGAKVIGGLGMLVHQGAAALELWTGRAAPVRVVYQMAASATSAKAQ